MVAEEEQGFEAVRFWIAGGNDHVALKLLLDGQENTDVKVWGKIAADIVKHAVRALKQDDPSQDESVMLALIERTFRERLIEETNFSGQLTGKIQ